MNNSNPKTRPPFLTWLCIVSAIVGISYIIMFIVLISYSLSGNVPSSHFPGIVMEYLHTGYSFVVAEIILTAFGLTGVLLMWKMKKAGFYLYAVIKAILYFLPVLCIGNNHLHFPGLLISSVMIVFYGILFTNFRKTT